MARLAGVWSGMASISHNSAASAFKRFAGVASGSLGVDRFRFEKLFSIS